MLANVDQYTPKYVELARKLVHHIARAGFRPGDRLGTENELCREHGVSRVTIRQALAILEEEGYISREKARGTFVRRVIGLSVSAGIMRGVVAIACSNAQAKHASEDSAFATVLLSMERALAQRGFAAQIIGLGEDLESDRARLAQMRGQGTLKGICTIGECLSPYADLLSGMPVVASCTFCHGALPWVGQDIEVVCRESIGYLLARGHRDIALICSSAVNRTAFSLFARAYRESFAAAGVSVRRGRLYHAYPGESLAVLTGEVLSDPVPPTAVFAENWRVCETLVAAVRARDWRIPNDISLIGYGQNVMQMVSPVAITAYVPDSKAIGDRAVRLLCDQIDGKGPPSAPVAVPGRLIERDSVRSIECTGTE